MDAHAAGEAGDDAGGEFHRADHQIVHAALVQVRRGVDFDRLFAGQQAREVDAVAPDVHQPTAAEFLVEAHVPFDALRAIAEAGADHFQLADLSAAQRVDHLVRERVRAVHEGFDEHLARLARRVEHLLALRSGQGEGLFAQNVLAGAQGFDGPLVMQRVGQGVVDGIDGGVGQQRVVAAVNVGNLS